MANEDQIYGYGRYAAQPQTQPAPYVVPSTPKVQENEQPQAARKTIPFRVECVKFPTSTEEEQPRDALEADYLANVKRYDQFTDAHRISFFCKSDPLLAKKQAAAQKRLAARYGGSPSQW